MQNPTEPKNNEEPKLATELFTEEEYERAWANAGPLARERFVRKTTKTKYRAATWVPTNDPDLRNPRGYVQKHRLPCKDLVDYTVAFVTYFKDKGASDAKS